MSGDQDFPPENRDKSQESNMIIIRANSLTAFSLAGQDRANHSPWLRAGLLPVFAQPKH